MGDKRTFKLCTVASPSVFHEDWRGWNFTIEFTRRNRQSIFAHVGFELQIESKTVFLEEFSPISLFDAKWKELVDWGCHAAFVSRGDKLPLMMRRVGLLEDEKLIVLYHSPLQYHARPVSPINLPLWKPLISTLFDSENYQDWTSAWNGAYPNGWVDTAGLSDQIKSRMSARTACILFDEDWSDGVRLVEDLQMQWGRGATLLQTRLTDNLETVLSGQNGALCLKSDFFFAFLRPTKAAHAERLMLHFCQRGANFRQIFFGVQSRKQLFTGQWKELGSYALISDTWDETARDYPKAQFIFHSNHRFASDFTRHFGYGPTGVQACSANCAVLVFAAISQSKSVERDVLIQAINEFGNSSNEEKHLTTFYGPVMWTHHNLEGRSPMILQIKKDLKAEVVFPYTVSKASARLEPSPKWLDRGGRAQQCSREGSWTILLPISVAVVLVVVVAICCTYCWRKNRRAYTLAQLNKARVAENARRVLLENERAKRLPSFDIELSEHASKPEKGREDRRSMASAVSSVDDDD